MSDAGNQEQIQPMQDRRRAQVFEGSDNIDGDKILHDIDEDV